MKRSRWIAAGSMLLACGMTAAQAPLAWKAQWIAAAGATKDTAAMPLFRREFALKARPVEAVLYVSALGQGEVHLNGVKVGDAELAPSWTDYRKTVRFARYDVTGKLHAGSNVVGVMVGNGMFNVVKTPKRYTKLEGSFGVPEVLLQLEVRYADGRRETIASDGSWKSAAGPIVFTSIYGGEDYDAGREVAGWDAPDVAMKDEDWQAVMTIAGPGGTLALEVAPPIKVMATYSAVRKTEVKPGVTVYDLGQNFAGWPAIEVEGAKGSTVKLTPGELLRADGTVTQASSGGPMWFSYTLKGGGREGWHPRFSYYGFRYVQVEWTGVGSVVSMTGEAVHTSSRSVGTFESSNTMLNRIQKLIVEAMHNNEESLFTDCPHREKLGWLEETHLIAAGLMYTNDLRGMYAASDANMADAQREDGDVPTIAPHYTQFGKVGSSFDDSPEWGSASVLAPWAVYRFDGEKAQLAKDYPTMQRYVANLEGRSVDGIVAFGLGDWYDIGPGNPGVSKLTTLGVTGTLMLYEDATVMQKVALLLGQTKDGARYAALAEKEKDAFNRRFLDRAAGFYDRGSQTAQAMPLALGIVPEEAKASVMAKLVGDIAAHQDHVTTGEIGYPYLVRVLMESGENDLVERMLMRTDAPSYGSQLAAGATALTEAWDANPRSSQDHFMLGGVEEWFYRGLGGIDFDMSRNNAGERITIWPHVVEGVDWVRCGFDSAMGKIESDWKREGGLLTFEVTVPAGAKARVELPGGKVERIGGGVHRFQVNDAKRQGR